MLLFFSVVCERIGIFSMCVGDSLDKSIYVGHTYNHNNVSMQKH